MSIPIQLVCVGSDQYELLEKAAARLNAIQTEFRFESIDPAHRPAALVQSRQNYLTEEVLGFLEGLLGEGRYRPSIIGFVDGPLASPKYKNLFGSVRADKGVAVVTTHRSDVYAAEKERFCTFYLIRYALSFLNPNIKSHGDPERVSCYFHFKRFKPDIRHSMDAGRLCDPCRQQLSAVPVEPGATRVTPAQWIAIDAMLGFVSGNLSRAVILKGGGIKGLAFASALVELNGFYKFDLYVGTSAGAIAAVLLAGGYKPEELVPILRDKNFREFMDASWWRALINLLFLRGMYRARTFSDWLTALLAAKIQKQGEILVSDLDKALVFASRRGNGAIHFESEGNGSTTSAAFAARCSMSIPFVFTPVLIENRNVYDGGLRANFPLEQFQDLHPYKPFIAVYLGRRDLGEPKGIVADLMDIAIDAGERGVVDRNRECVVEIDPTPISTLNFKLSATEKEFLICLGRSSALDFLHARKLSQGPTAEEVTAAKQQTESLRASVVAARAQRRRIRRRWAYGLGIALVLSVCAAAVWRPLG